MSKSITIQVDFYEREELSASDIAYDLFLWEYDINGIVTVQDQDTGQWITVPAAEFDYETFLDKHADDQSLGIVMKKDDVKGHFMLSPSKMVFEVDQEGPDYILAGWNCPNISYYLEALQDVVIEGGVPFVKCKMLW